MVHHIGLITHDLDRPAAFYGGVLGLREAERWEQERIIFFELGGALLELVEDPSAPAPGAPRAAHLALAVDDVAASYAALNAAGAAPISPPERFRRYTIAFIADPDGNQIELIQEVIA